MGLISVSLPSDGSTADVSDYNTPITTIVSAINGNLDNANIVAGAAIAGSKLADASVTSAKIVGIDKSLMTTDSNPYKFNVYRAAAANTGSGAFALVACDTEVFDTNNNHSAGVYTVPVTGFYMFAGGISVNSTGQDVTVAIFKNGTDAARGTQVTINANICVTVSILLSCTAGDTVDMRAYGSTARALNIASPHQNYFCGFLISRT